MYLLSFMLCLGFRHRGADLRVLYSYSKLRVTGFVLLPELLISGQCRIYSYF